MIEIFTDLFNIVSKIKQIDPMYRVFRNVKKNRFELYYQNGLNLNLELTLNYPVLDMRTVNKIYESKIENADLIFEKIEKFNGKLL